MNKMKLYTIIGAGLFALTSTTLLACSEIEDGSNDMSSWPEVKDYVKTLEHPCMLHTETDFEFVKGKVQAGAQPWKNAFDHLSRGGNSLSQSNYKASLHAIRMCTDSLSKTKWRFLHGKRNTDTLRSRFPPQIRHRAYSEPCSVLGYRATGMENVPDRELPGMETGGKLKIES